MVEQPETDSATTEVEPDGLQKLASLMDDAGNLPTEQEVEQQEEPAPQSQKTEPESQPVEQAESQDDQTAEIDYEGAKYRVPAALKDAFLRQADYTRKTQDVATVRAAVEQERQAVQRLQQEAQQFVGQYAAIQQIDGQIANLQKLDWQKLASEDPLQNLQLRQAWSELLHVRQTAVQQLEQARLQNVMQQAKATQDATQAGLAVLAREVPGWGPELQKALLPTAQSIGYRPEELASVVDPRFVKLVHKAYLYDQAQQQKTVAEKQVKQAPPKVVRPSASQGPNVPQRNEGLLRLRKTGNDADAVAALRQLGIE